MQFRQDEDVVTPTGEVVGQVDRVVMNPKTKQNRRPATCGKPPNLQRNK